VLLALTVLGLAVAGVGAYGLWLKYSMPDPPAVDMTGLDQEIIDAVEAARAAVRQHPRSPIHWGHLGAVLRAHEFNSESNFCFAQAERLDANDYRWPYLISLSVLNHDQEAALPYLRRAADLCGDQPAPRLRLGEVLLDRGETGEAEPLFRAVLEKDPDDPRANLGMGQIALARGDVEAALKHLRHAADRASRAKAIHTALAQAYRLHGDEKEAEQEQRILAALPDSWGWPDPVRQYVHDVWTGLRARMANIDSFDKQGLHEEAVVAARQAVQRYPNSAVARLVLGEMLNRSHNSPAAEPVLREAIRMDPRRTKAHFELGYALQAQRRPREAVESYRRTVELQPDFAVAHYNLALCLLELKDEAGAEKELLAAIRYRTEYPDALLALAMLYGRQGKYADARKYAEEAGRAAPSDSRPKELLKELEAKQAREEKATKDKANQKDKKDMKKS
jgi:tetratricopeptide (TPR) repeat protein